MERARLAQTLGERLRRSPDWPDGPGRFDPVHRRPRAVLRLPQLTRPSRCRSTSAPPVWKSWSSTPRRRMRWSTASTPPGGPAARRPPRLLGVAALRDVDRSGCRAGPARRPGDAPPGATRGQRERPGAGGRRGPGAGPDRRPRATAGRLTRVDARRLRDHRAAVDLAVETARASGALGARMTGGGFGGCIIALSRPGSPTPWPKRSGAVRSRWIRSPGPLRGGPLGGRATGRLDRSTSYQPDTWRWFTDSSPIACKYLT